jgi:MATE family multidrug resistance protein
MLSLSDLDHKIWRIAWPAIVSNISIPLLGLIDAAILGHLGDSRYLGGVAIGSALLSFLYWGFGFLRMGTTGLVARAHGAGDEGRAILVLGQSLVLAQLLAALVLLLHPLWLALGFQLMAPQAELEPLARSYAEIRIYSAPAVLATYAIVGWFIGRQDTRWPMFFVVLTNSANILLDVLFILGLGLGSDGAAMATVCAEYLGLALALWALWRTLPERPGRELLRQLRELAAYRALLRSNRHLFVRTVCLLASFAFFTAMGDKLGAATLAANTLMMHLIMLAAYGMDGFAFAAEGLAGESLGARRLDTFHRCVGRCALWCGVSAALVSMALALSHPLLFGLLTDIAEVQHLLRQYLWWLLALPLVAAPSYLLDGVFIGAAESRAMMLTMLFSALLVYLPAWYLTRDWGNHGLWLAFTLFNGARGLSLGWWYRRLSRQGSWLGSPPATAE